MTIVSCNHCQKKYKVDENAGKLNSHTKFRCKNCGQLSSIKAPPYPLEKYDNKTYDLVAPKRYNIYGQTTSFLTASPLSEIGTHSPLEVLKKITLRKKFTVALIGIMIFSLLGTYLVSNSILQKNAENQIISNARFLLTTIEASRDFTSKVVKPVLYNELPNKFIVEAMSSSFGARNIFDIIKRKYPEFYFKHASLNPRNELNLADRFESSIIQKFEADPELKEWQGYRSINGKTDFIIMKPIVTEIRCMKCHSVPEKAPRKMLERYGITAGFGRRPGDIIGALSISVPASEILAIAKNDLTKVIFIVSTCFVILIIIINLFFKQIVIKPIEKLKSAVEEISAGRVNISIYAEGSDEINDLARGVERMRISINLAMSRLKTTRTKPAKNPPPEGMAMG